MKHTDMIKYYLQQVHQLMVRQRTRRQLLQLDEAALHDVGITRSQAIEEGIKPFWKSSLQANKMKQNRAAENSLMIIEQHQVG